MDNTTQVIKMDDNLFQKQLNEASRKSAIIRGSVLNRVAILETMIDFFLTNHFCSTVRQKKEFLTWLTPSNIITFENKRNIFNKIIKEYYPDFKKEIPDYHARLEDIRDFRNKVAHYTLDISPAGVEKFMQSENIILLDNTKQMIEVTQDEVLKIIEITQKISDEISKLNPI